MTGDDVDGGYGFTDAGEKARFEDLHRRFGLGKKFGLDQHYFLLIMNFEIQDVLGKKKMKDFCSILVRKLARCWKDWTFRSWKEV